MHPTDKDLIEIGERAAKLAESSDMDSDEQALAGLRAIWNASAMAVYAKARGAFADIADSHYEWSDGYHEQGDDCETRYHSGAGDCVGECKTALLSIVRQQCIETKSEGSNIEKDEFQKVCEEDSGG